MIPDSFYYVLILLIFSFVILAWIKCGSLINPVSYFNIWWGSFLFISSINLVGIRTPRIETYWMFLLALSAYSIGSITLLENHNTKKMMSPGCFKHYDYLSENKILKIFLYLQIITFIILLFFFKKSLNMLTSLDPGTYRYLVYTDEGVFQGHKILLNYYLRPAVFITTFITLAGVFYGIIKKRFFILAVVNIFLYSMVILGRSAIILIVFCSIIGFLYMYDTNLIKLKKRYLVILIIPIIFVITLSIFRKSYASAKSATDILYDYFIWYLTAPFTAFDFFLHNFKTSVDYDFSICRSFFGGIEEFLEPFIRKVYPNFNQINNSSHEMIGQFRDLGGIATHHNSHYTMLFTFYRDAGLYGILIYSYIFGVSSTVAYNSFRKNPSVFNIIILILLTYLSIMSTTRWEFMYSWTWLIILCSFILTRKLIFKRN